MKLRIKGNTIRLRLSQPEVKQFGEVGKVEDQTQFPQGMFKFGLRKNEALEAVTAQYDQEGIWVEIPKATADFWMQDSEVGFSFDIDLPNEKTLGILVEKDFQCLHREGVDESDLYPNPHA